MDLDQGSVGNPMSERFAEWELEVITALAHESLEKLRTKEWVKFPERFVEKFEHDTQDYLRSKEGQRERSALLAHAKRLNLGPGRQPHLPLVDDLHLDDHEIAAPEVREAWSSEIMRRLRPSPLEAALERTRGAS